MVWNTCFPKSEKNIHFSTETKGYQGTNWVRFLMRSCNIRKHSFSLSSCCPSCNLLNLAKTTVLQIFMHFSSCNFTKSITNFFSYSDSQVFSCAQVSQIVPKKGCVGGQQSAALQRSTCNHCVHKAVLYSPRNLYLMVYCLQSAQRAMHFTSDSKIGPVIDQVLMLQRPSPRLQHW